MTPPLLELEGTWEEILAHAAAWAGRRVRLTVLSPATEPAPERAPSVQERDPERIARIKSIRGKFACPGMERASETLQRERQVDKEKEERAFQGSQA
jgi:hypothetical protein